MPEVEKFSLAEGRMFTKEEEDSLSQIVVLGSVVKENYLVTIPHPEKLFILKVSRLRLQVCLLNVVLLWYGYG